MHLSNWLLFCSVALLVTFSPGPAVLLAISNAIAVGPRRAMISSMGNGFGLFIISGVAMAGMGVVLATSATAFMLLKLAGALYLVYLGIKQWRSKTSIVADAPVALGAANPNSFWKLFRQGLTVALTNPKAILFFSALFPQFITPGEPVAIQFTVLTTSFVACAMLAHLFYANLARLLKTQLATPGRAKLFNRISGGAFVLLGLSLLRLRAKAT
ncbi:threonine/homoserine/homoserine lactone efflux protein [Janthinobacterium sp. 35]|uniref:LysE family translocator n=1 Tax=Janthinobacterium tructae TaxID=2590869 RepID=A0A4Y6RBR0_9BURK|nr:MULTISPECIES: LysE family transporter [Janthinobacterium]MBH1981419.1 LysE family transporter [Burkholderiales bacterium]MBH1993960.1 LysE family transporter [Burkholderiales bacterium]MBH2068560.1 LysE family transporter [Burkholderiales bacterium]PIG30485.1 threonine/homoserine/homoserine lactone efflux protein [Janthinobacterium sp. 35]PLY42403.1 lysine transporter LysE [Janthinobacterium sp. ROICE36]